MPFAAIWMDLEIIILSEINQKEKDRYHTMSLTYGMYNTTQVNLPIKRDQTHRHRKQTYHCPWGRKVAEEWTGNLGLADANYYM